MKAREFPVLTEAIMRRFWAKTRLDPSGCVVWTGASDGGYGKYTLPGEHLTQAHRVALAWAEGGAPQDMTVDHLCRNRSCVAPDHLEFVSQAENNRRRAALTTHCPQGHPYSPENTYVRPGTANRRCRTCKRIRSRRPAAA